MDWKKERDALIAQTFAFVQSVTGRIEETARLEGALAPAAPLRPPPDVRDAPIEAAPFEAGPFEPMPFEPMPVEPMPVEPMPFEPVPVEPVSADSAAADPVAQIETPHSATPLPAVIHNDMKDEIQARINSFRAHQDRFNRERAEYFSATLQRLRATIEAPLPRAGQIDQPHVPLSRRSSSRPATNVSETLGGSRPSGNARGPS